MNRCRKKYLPPASGKFYFNRKSYDLLKSKLEKSVSGAGVHSLASHLNEILNGCKNYCYWINEDIINRPDNYSLYNKYDPIRTRIMLILEKYGEKYFWDQLILYEEAI
jgi:hypothetical protein